MSSTPTHLGKFQIIREIARSNDIVYEGWDDQMNRRVAVKELALLKGASAQQEQDRIDRFRREARAAGTISHPNIMTVYELGTDGDKYFIAMEYLDGHTLRNEIDTKGNLPVDRAVEISKEVLQGLAFAHSRGVIHRDIKPDNIQILSDERIKITDFGIARLTFEPNLTLDGQVFGTPSYMSPEQIIGKELDCRSDLFSVGVMLYEMIEGRKPFPGDSVVAITHAITSQEMQPMTNASAQLAAVIKRSVEKVASLRYANADEFSQAIDAALNAPQYSQDQYSFGGYVPDPQYGYNPVPGGFGGNPAPPPIIAPPNPGYAGNYGSQMPFIPQSYPQAGFGSTQLYAQPLDPYLQNMYSQNGMVPPAPGSQFFYPPPPRRVFITAETKAFLSKLFIAVLIFGTAIGLIIILVNTVSQFISEGAKAANDQQVSDQLNRKVANLPPSEKVKQLQDALPSIHTPSVLDEQNEKIAIYDGQLADEAYSARDYENAEKYYMLASEHDSKNPLYYGKLADVYKTVAQTVADVQSRSILWGQAVQQWQDAANYTQDQTKREIIQSEAVKSNISWAKQLASSGDYFDARLRLVSAQNFHLPDNQLNGQIDSLLQNYAEKSIHGSR